MNVVILAAGLGSRFGDVTAIVPKCLLTLHSKNILQMQLEALTSHSEVEKIFIVVGYQKNLIAEFILNSEFKDQVELIVNNDYESTNNMYSLFLASDQVRGKCFILCNGDVAFTSKSILRFSGINKSEILVDLNQFTIDNMKVVFDSKGLLRDISKKIEKVSSHGISLDVYKFSEADSEVLFEFIEKEIAENRKNNWTEAALSELSKNQIIELNVVDIGTDLWFEVDNHEDIQKARKIFVPKEDFYNFKYYFFDLDGTLLIENEPVKESIKLINQLHERGKSVFFLTNNSAYTDAQHAKRLMSKGFAAVPNQVISALGQTIRYLLRNEIREIFFLGTAAASKDFLEAQISLSFDKPQVVIIGNDTELTYNKFQEALELIHGGTPYILTHCDFSRPTNFGPLPDVGAWGLLIQELTGVAPVHVFGKPNSQILESYFQDLQDSPSIKLSFDNAVIIGDRLNTDIALGVNVNIFSILTLTGSTSEKTFQESLLKPDLTVNSVSDLLPSQ
jgi:HAD superfamily hydrolase (TIGR01450 family)